MKQNKYKALFIIILLMAFPVAYLTPDNGRYVFLLAPLYFVIYFALKMYDSFKRKSKQELFFFLLFSKHFNEINDSCMIYRNKPNSMVLKTIRTLYQKKNLYFFLKTVHIKIA